VNQQEYRDYLQGEHWKSVRERFKGRRCLGCDGNREMTLHHVTYARIGSELDKDLRPLCWSCHQEVHRLIESGNGKLSHTDRHIEKIRRQRRLPPIGSGAKIIFGRGPVAIQTAAAPTPKGTQQPKRPSKLTKKQRRNIRRTLNQAQTVAAKKNEAKHEREKAAAEIALADHRQRGNPTEKIIRELRRHRGIN